MAAPVSGPDAKAFLDSVERFAGRPLSHRREIETLLSIAKNRSMREVFNDIVFMAKFITNASSVLRRQGGDSAETGKLAQELRESLEKSSALLRTLIKEEPQEVKSSFTSRYLTLTPEAMTSFLALLSDLAWVKNYTIDTHDEI